MNLLFLDTPSFAKLDMLDAFKQCNINCTLFFHEHYQERISTAFEKAFEQALCTVPFQYDFAFSFNYFPVLSTCCQKHHIKYISYVYDSPLVSLYSYTLLNPCNYVFIFDRVTYEELKSGGIQTVYYMPLAANVERLTQLTCDKYFKSHFSSPVSFVGTLYNEEHNLFDRLNNLPDYTTGYLNAIMDAQEKIYGSFILQDTLTPQILHDLEQSLPYTPLPDGVEKPEYVYANYFLARKVTATERQRLLQQVSEHFPLKLYTPGEALSLPLANNMGTVDYYQEMPLVFKNSLINLNISLRSIRSGIPLRCMDIMGAGAFLLTNYQADFLEYFIPGEDYVYFESEDDLLNKIRYYLSHESERQQICENIKGKMKDNHTYVHRVNSMLSILS